IWRVSEPDWRDRMTRSARTGAQGFLNRVLNRLAVSGFPSHGPMSALPKPHSEHPLEERLDFIGLDAAATARLAQVSPLILKHIGPALTRFYDRVEETPQVARFFSGRDRMDVVQDKQALHWSAIAAGRLDEDYYQSSLTIGNVHARIGLEPQWYVGGYGLVLETLIKAMMNEWMAGEVARMRKRKPAETLAAADTMAQTMADMIKAVMIDIDLAVSTYFAA